MQAVKCTMVSIGFTAVVVYLDDFFIYVHPRSRSVLRHFIGFIATLRVPHQLEQVIDPCQCIAFIGIAFIGIQRVLLTAVLQTFTKRK